MIKLFNILTICEYSSRNSKKQNDNKDRYICTDCKIFQHTFIIVIYTSTSNLHVRKYCQGHSVSNQPMVPRWHPPIFMKLCENVVLWPKRTLAKKKIRTPYSF